MKNNTTTLNETKSGRLWSWLSRMFSEALNHLTMVAIGLGIILIITLPFYIKFKVWEVQHPEAPTWSFFIPDGR